MTKPVCPRCGQDYVYKVKITPLNKMVYLCKECDALWELETPISQKNYIAFSSYMRKYGYTGDWSLIEESESI